MKNVCFKKLHFYIFKLAHLTVLIIFKLAHLTVLIIFKLAHLTVLIVLNVLLPRILSKSNKSTIIQSGFISNEIIN